MEGLSSVTVFLPSPQMECVTCALGTMAPGPTQAPTAAPGSSGLPIGVSVSCFSRAWLEGPPRSTLLNSGLQYVFPQHWFPEPEERDAGDQESRGRVSRVGAGSQRLTASGTGCVLGAEGAAHGLMPHLGGCVGHLGPHSLQIPITLCFFQAALPPAQGANTLVSKFTDIFPFPLSPPFPFLPPLPLPWPNLGEFD